MMHFENTPTNQKSVSIKTNDPLTLVDLLKDTNLMVGILVNEYDYFGVVRDDELIHTTKTPKIPQTLDEHTQTMNELKKLKHPAHLMKYRIVYLPPHHTLVCPNILYGDFTKTRMLETLSKYRIDDMHFHCVVTKAPNWAL